MVHSDWSRPSNVNKCTDWSKTKFPLAARSQSTKLFTDATSFENRPKHTGYPSVIINAVRKQTRRASKPDKLMDKANKQSSKQASKLSKLSKQASKDNQTTNNETTKNQIKDARKQGAQLACNNYVPISQLTKLISWLIGT